MKGQFLKATAAAIAMLGCMSFAQTQRPQRQREDWQVGQHRVTKRTTHRQVRSPFPRTRTYYQKHRGGEQYVTYYQQPTGRTRTNRGKHTGWTRGKHKGWTSRLRDSRRPAYSSNRSGNQLWQNGQRMSYARRRGQNRRYYMQNGQPRYYSQRPTSNRRYYMQNGRRRYYTTQQDDRGRWYWMNGQRRYYTRNQDSRGRWYWQAGQRRYYSQIPPRTLTRTGSMRSQSTQYRRNWQPGNRTSQQWYQDRNGRTQRMRNGTWPTRHNHKHKGKDKHDNREND
jgi:hypothetical protein